VVAKDEIRDPLKLTAARVQQVADDARTMGAKVGGELGVQKLILCEPFT
jgi:hypothetical protein